ncbi:T9SS type A sorting domain-containing protein [Chryseobacterium tructae]|nr:T9SS type A sorting domain-containing protein [Chryseobacterium tructae]MDN3693696.1 T9SS type A sorting domain-containing protein [Chryseobacterium tructae]
MWANRNASGNNIMNINIDEMAIYATSLTLSTKDIKKKENITKIAENPVKEYLQLQLNPALKENRVTVYLYNAAGQKVLTTQYSKLINIANLSEGVYIAEVTDGKTTERLSFIKK